MLGLKLIHISKGASVAIAESNSSINHATVN